MIDGLIDAELLSDFLAIGCISFVAGSLLPLAFRLVGWVVDIVRVVIK